MRVLFDYVDPTFDSLVGSERSEGYHHGSSLLENPYTPYQCMDSYLSSTGLGSAYILSLWTEEKRDSAARGVYNERSKEANLFQNINRWNRITQLKRNDHTSVMHCMSHNKSHFSTLSQESITIKIY
ncbi:hypothetical protein M9H77_06115 [Catharanthus roseus]|uniref:Uncharacterized protein n=1 Tax=Catharanthus roseus TaxID=4058 RepID=A0ACC0BRB6_CATRO|nr:hypothetical protein M9H77_06115 [Catharanthus roseus]